MAVTVPPIPHKVPMLNPQGFLNPAWSAWFRELFARIGGISALSNTELENEIDQNLSELEADVSALQTRATALETDVSALESLTTTHTSQITTLQTQVNDLNQGPVL